MSNPAPGFYPDPNDANKQRYWDGNEWTDNYAGFFPDPDNPGMVRYWDGKEWSGETMPEQALAVMQRISKLPGASTSWNRISPQDARGQVNYLDAKERLRKTRIRMGVLSAATLIGALISSGGMLIVALVLIMQGGADTFNIFFLAIAVIAIIFALYQGGKYFRARKRTKDAFLCSVQEAEAVPDGSLCAVTGIIAASDYLDAFGRQDCVYLSYWYNQNDNNHQVINNSAFYLQEGETRIYVDDNQLGDELLGPSVISSLSSDAWAAFVGDEISLTGTITTRPDGSRAFTGKVEIGFPIAAYQDGRITSASQADSARPVSQAPMGPAVVSVDNGSLHPSP